MVRQVVDGLHQKLVEFSDSLPADSKVLVRYGTIRQGALHNGIIRYDTAKDRLDDLERQYLNEAMARWKQPQPLKQTFRWVG